eukprot:TRINITY_DN3210_c0_g1_i1.p1 TRINITY_DN3210_c0_g1~~TRINITY_DN3210_c0_g1_i1.p1  ORF type:complete len:349 (+),score=72.54 TRINITY_DN3210_c0_g1_i1:515-1561(+)
MGTLLQQSSATNGTRCNVHRYEAAYWQGDTATSWLPLNIAPLNDVWSLMASTSLHTCEMSTLSNVNVSTMYEPTADARVVRQKKDLGASYPLRLRPLGTVCPSVDQMQQALNLNNSLPRPNGLTRLMLDTHTVIIGDSLSLGIGVQVNDSWPILLQRSLEAMTGLTAAYKPCMASKSGFSMLKFYKRAAKRLTKYYKLVPDPVLLAKQCFNLRPGVLVFALGTNDFVENTAIDAYVAMLNWTVEWAMHKAHGSIKALIVLTPVMPSRGKWYLPNTTHTWPADILPVLRASVKHMATRHKFEYAAIADVDTATRWCAEHNYADGTHPNQIGYFLMMMELVHAITTYRKD